jgi:hypothetical protein
MLRRGARACPALDAAAAAGETPGHIAAGTSIMRNTEEIWRLVDAKARDAIELADRVWGMPELCYAEVRSCAEHTAPASRPR